MGRERWKLRGCRDVIDMTFRSHPPCWRFILHLGVGRLTESSSDLLIMFVINPLILLYFRKIEKVTSGKFNPTEQDKLLDSLSARGIASGCRRGPGYIFNQHRYCGRTAGASQLCTAETWWVRRRGTADCWAGQTEHTTAVRLVRRSKASLLSSLTDIW